MAVLPLEGLVVLEFSHTVMGPTCGVVLADLGADVIRVEPAPDGDRTRRLHGFAFVRGLLSFYLACGIGGMLNIEVGSTYLHSGGTWWMAGLIGSAAGAVWNFTACSVLTWRR